LKDVFNKSISYQLIDFSDEKEENEKKIEKSNKESTEMDDNVEWKDSIKGDPVVVATNGTYCVIRRGHKIHAYGIIKIGDPISSIKRWRDKRVLHSMLTKGNYVLLPKPEPYNYDTDNKDLQKSHILHKERLVQKRVPVHHANGSITYRMQWVKVSKEPNKPVVSTMHQERPSNPTKNPIPQEGHTETPTEESEHTPDADITSPLSDIPALRGYYKEIDDTFNGEEYKDEDSVTGRLNMILSISQKHWSTIKDILLKDCNNDNSVSPFLKDVRKGILKMTRPSSFRTLGSHPSILHHALINLLGEDVYKNARSQLVSANLTINTTEEHIPDILKNGYKGKTIMDYIKYHSSEDELEENIRDYHRLIQESEDEDDLENNMFELDGIWVQAPTL
jgi:hypothetical protein